MKKIIFAFYCFCVINFLTFSQINDIKTIVLEINNVTINGGTLHISVCCSEAAFRNSRPDFTFEFSPINTKVRQEISIPLGECVILVYQDTNNNGKSDTGLFGIPKEPVGITNWNGRGPPGNFRRHKINIEPTTDVVEIHLFQL